LSATLLAVCSVTPALLIDCTSLFRSKFSVWPHGFFTLVSSLASGLF